MRSGYCMNCTKASRHEPLDELVRGGPTRARPDQSPHDSRREGQISRELSSKLSKGSQPQLIQLNRICRADDLELDNQEWGKANGIRNIRTQQYTRAWSWPT
jgi:hypothetical protein